MIDKVLFLIVCIAGIIITILLFLTEKKPTPTSTPHYKNTPLLTLLGSGMLIIFFLYLFRVLVVFTTGLYSKISITVLSGLIPAITPLIIIYILIFFNKRKKNTKQVQGEDDISRDQQ